MEAPRREFYFAAGARQRDADERAMPHADYLR